jgi:hypothetical protein
MSIEVQAVVITTSATEVPTKWTFTVKPIEPMTMATFGSTEFHESAHAVAGIVTGSNVIEATSTPGAGYRGRTILDGFNPIAFAAPHALGCDGCGYDLAVLDYKGYSTESAAADARNVLWGRKPQINAVSSAMAANRTLNGNQIWRIMDWVKNTDVEIEAENPFGEKWSLVTKAREVDGYIIPVEIPEFLNKSTPQRPLSEKLTSLKITSINRFSRN